MKKFLLLLSVVALAFTGCYEDVGPEQPSTGQFYISPDYIEVGAQGGSYYTNVTSDYTWYAYSEYSWISLNNNYGPSGTSSLDFTVEKNNSTSDRYGAITIYTDDYNLALSLTVWQAAGEPEQGGGEDNASWSYIGQGKFRGGGAIDGLFSIDTSVEIDVDVYESDSNKGVYKIVDPWVATFAYGFGYSSIDEALAGGLSTTHADLIVDASNPEAVVIAEQSLGVDIGYGDIYVFTGYPDYLDAATGAGTLVDGVITFPSRGTLIYMPAYNAESIYYGNIQGMLRISLPGAIPPCDIEVGVAKFSEVFPEMASQYSDEEAFAFGIWGSEIASAKCLIAPTSTFDSYFNNGWTMEQILANHGGEMTSSALNEINGTGYIDAVTETRPGTNYTVAVYATNSYGKTAVASAQYVTAGTNPQPCEISVDLDKMSTYLSEYSEYYPDSESLSYKVVGKDIVRAKYLMLDTETADYYAGEGVSLKDLLFNYGNDFDDYELADINGSGYINGFINLAPATSYTVAIYAEDVYGGALVVSDTHTTDAATASTRSVKEGKTNEIQGLKLAEVTTIEKKAAMDVVKCTTLSLPGGKFTRKAVVGSMQLKSDAIPFSSVRITK